MNRKEMLDRAGKCEKIWDFIVVGGGATGAGCCLDAASRGFEVLLLEQNDFGKGTSSRSTKLVHGGVRYLAQGNLSLVREALKERGIMLKNAPHLVKKQAFIVPCYTIREKFFYGAGLKIYDVLADKYGFGKSRILSKKETLENLPNAKKENLRGGVLYFDGQFDDTRLLINIVETAAEQGASVLNYASVLTLQKDAEGKINGVKFRDAETSEEYDVKAKIVVNATGAFTDSIRKMSNEKAKNIIAPSQGAHLVFDESFLSSKNALMIPKTSDGRVLFAIPWLGKTLIGTTDTPVEKAALEPRAVEEETDFIIETAGKYLTKAPTRTDVLSVFVGVRPLVKAENARNTAALARDHTIEVDQSNLLTITGGKWTTYRKMAEDVVNQAIKLAKLPEKKCVTENLKIHGFKNSFKYSDDLAIYGSDTENIQKLIAEKPDLAEKLHADLPYRAAEIVWVVRNEMAQTVEDALARRTRTLFLNARAAIEIAPKIAEIMAREMGKDKNWQKAQIEAFGKVAENYVL